MVSLLIRSQKIVPTFLLNFNSWIWLLMNSILLIPIIEIFISINVCENDVNSNKMINYYYPDIECWKGNHIGYAASSAFGIILFVSLNAFYVLLYFDDLCNERRAKNKKNGRASFIANINQIIIIILFNFLNKNENQIILIFYTLFGNFFVFGAFHYFSPFSNVIVKKTFRLLTSLSVWNSFLILIAKIVEGNLFQGVIYAWLFSFPLIIILEIASASKDMKYILNSSTKFYSANDLESHVKYVLNLLDQEGNKFLYYVEI